MEAADRGKVSLIFLFSTGSVVLFIMWKPIDVITQTKITRSPKPGILYQHC